MISRDAPIGVFDSGLGGLSIAREIRHRLPAEDIIYLADSAYTPYGGRPLDEIRDLSVAMVAALVRQGAKLIVVACNTASAAAIEEVRARFSLPVVALEPAVKPAAEESRTRRIAVLATPATLQTDRFHRLIDNHGSDVEVIKIACPGFVELVEEGDLDGERTMREVREVLAPVLAEDVDEVVLGCTHYPFLRGAIARVLGPGVEILDSGEAVARQVQRVLVEHDLRGVGAGGGRFELFTTGDPERVTRVARRLLGEAVEVRRLPGL